MAEGDSSDLIMKFVLDGQPVVAESTTRLISSERSPNPLLKGVKHGHMFEIDEFSFKAGTLDDEAGNGADPKQTAKAKGKTPASSAQRGAYRAWRAGKPHKYQFDVQPVTFTRPIDASSSTPVSKSRQYD